MHISDWSGADEDHLAISTLRNRSLSYIARLMLPKPKSRIWKVGDLLNQDEFYRKITGNPFGSPYCTAYAAMHSHSAFLGVHPSEGMRYAFIKYCLDEGVIHDTPDRQGGSTVKTSLTWTNWFNNNQSRYKAKSYIIDMGTTQCMYLMKRNYPVISSFIISNEFIADRSDDNKINGLIHGGRKRNGHAILEVMHKGNIIIANNYGIGLKNFAVPNEHIDEWFDYDFHRRFGVVTVYS